MGGLKIGVDMIGQGQDWTGQNWKDVIRRDRIGETGVELYMGQG